MSDGQNGLEQAVFGGGCFWCTEAVFDELRGVERVESGYAGGAAPSPTYEQVCAGATGHAEVVRVTYDPGVISYRDLLGVFFATHDPTQLNRQGADVGTQYRSAVFYETAEQREAAVQMIAELEAQGVWGGRVVTTLEPLAEFYPAEEYHRDYYRRNPDQGYCRAVIAPKVAKFRQQFLDRLKK
jgi:peptide-methionine (S)-S-oxide reductase